MIDLLWSVAIGASTSSDVARGWYLWTVGRDADALEVARAATAARPSDLGAFQLLAAMEVQRGAGGSLEIATREEWGLAPSDPVQRTKLATVLALRHREAGPFCDEVSTLVARVPEGEARAWAALADRQRELRCEGKTDHADAELRRLLAGGGVGWGDGVLAKVEAGYFKPELPDELERLWAEEPERLARAGAVFAEEAAGPGKAAAQRVTEKALGAAVDGDDPVLVHAAYVAYSAAGRTNKADEALARLKVLDAAADPTLARTLDGVGDPPIYGSIAGCVRQELNSALRCLDSLTPPDGAPAAAWHFQRRAVLEGLRRADDAHAEARAAWQADPTNRSYARWFVRSAVARGDDAELAAAALDVAVPTLAVPDGVPEARRGAVAADLDLRSSVLRLVGRPAEAVDGQRLALSLAPTPERRLLLGLVLADAGAADEAVLQLSHGLVKAQLDTALITSARDALGVLAKTRGTSVAVLVAEAGREPGPFPEHPSIGKPLVVPDGWLPTAPDGAAPAPTVVATWSTLDPGWAAVLARLEALTGVYAEKGVRFGAVGVDAVPPTPREPGRLHLANGGPAATATVRLVALPSVFVRDAKGKVSAVLAPWDPSKLDLEKALDALLPKN